MRALANKANVATSTIARIESGEVDPTFDMLRRLVLACGMDLVVSSSESSVGEWPKLDDLRTAWATTEFGEEPEWTRFRAFLDRLYGSPGLPGVAIRKRPAKSGSQVIDSLLAGIAEKVASDFGMRPPSWTRTVPPLRESWAPPGTARMKDRWRNATPAQLLERGIIIDEASLWRSRESIGP